MTFAFLGTWFPHLENKSTLAALDRLLVADSQTNMWNGKQITFAQFQAIVASNVESVNGLTGIVSLGLTDLDDIPDPTTGSTFLSWNGSAFVWAGGWVGETNLADNVGSGANIWKDKTGVTFNFRGINGIQGIAAVVNSDNIDINFDVASLTAGQKTALVAATATEMAAAIDLTDLGDVTITTPSDGQVLTWNGSAWVNEDLPSSSGGFNINSLSLVTTANVTNDFVAIYSAALAAHKKISITNLLTLAGFTGDIYFKVSSSDTTPGYGATKLTATDGIKRTIVNPTAAESISFTLDYENLAAASTPATATSLLAIFDDDETYKKLTLDELFALDLTHLLKAGGSMTGALLEAKWADKASATTVDLSTATGNLVHITGTTTITGFGTVQAGARFTLVFDGIVTVTYNATSLILGSAAENITTAAWDVMVIVSEWGGNWRMESYAKASGLAVVSPDTSMFSPRTKEYTAGEALTAGDMLYISAANTVKRMKADTYDSTENSISTAANHTSGVQFFPLSSNKNYLQFSGGWLGTNGYLYAQVRTLNTAETNVWSGLEQTIYSTGSGCNWYSVCQISTDKFLVIFQAITAGAEAWIKCAVVSVSWTTITVGSITTIETTGNASSVSACAKVDTDKACIFYRKDSDGDIYAQVLTVSGTTITTNTPVSVLVTSNACYKVAWQLATNSVLLVYSEWSSANIYANVITVSGTTPTIWAQQTPCSFGDSSHRLWLSIVSSTKALLFNNDDSASYSPSTDSVSILTISGSTVARPGSAYEINGWATWRITRYWPCVVIDTQRAMIATLRSSTEARLNLLDISGTTPSSLQTSTHSISASSDPPAMCKVAPWTLIAQFATYANDYIFRLTPVSTSRIGMTEFDVSNAALEDITLRFQLANTSWLTAGTTYYIDDNGRLTSNYSSTAPVAGIADSTTTLLLT